MTAELGSDRLTDRPRLSCRLGQVNYNPAALALLKLHD